MKRQLDDIELEEIIGFHIFHNSLVVKTKEESYTYEYKCSVELLKRILYFLHRYDVEYYRNEDNKKNRGIEKENSNNEKVKQYVAKWGPFNMLLGFIVGSTMIFGPIVFAIAMVVDLLIVYKMCHDIKEINSQSGNDSNAKNINTTDILNEGFASLKECVLSYLNKLSTEIQNSQVVEHQYIEELEQAFQKRIGTYPIKKFDK